MLQVNSMLLPAPFPRCSPDAMAKPTKMVISLQIPKSWNRMLLKARRLTRRESKSAVVRDAIRKEILAAIPDAQLDA